jgi:hypothetical protein
VVNSAVAFYAKDAMTMLPMLEPPKTAPPMPLSGSIHLASYPRMALCRFCFDDSHNITKKLKTWIVEKNLTTAERGLK